MALLELDPVPQTDRDVEDYIASMFHASGWSVEANSTLRDEDDNRDVLEMDARAVRLGRTSREVVVSEAKNGGWGYPDFFKLVGWKTHLGFDEGVLATTRSIDSIPRGIVRRAPELGIVLISLSDPDEARRTFGEAGFGEVDRRELALWRFAAQVTRRLRDHVRYEAKHRQEVQAPKALRELDRLITDRVLFTDDPAQQATLLYEAYQNRPNITRACAGEADGGEFEANIFPARSAHLTEAMYHGQHLTIQAAMWLEYRARLSILRAATEMVIAGRTRIDSGDGLDVALFSLPSSFQDGLSWLARQDHYWRYPVLWEQFMWTWGGFLLEGNEDDEFAALGESSGVPVESVPTALKAFDHLFSSRDGWFRTPGNTTMRSLLLFPYHFAGVGVFRRRSQFGWTPRPQQYEYTAADMVKRHNVTIHLLAGD